MEQDVLKKLRFKEGQASAVLNAPEGYDPGIGTGGAGKYEFVLLYVRSKEELAKWLPNVMPQLEEDAVFWICYPKKTAKLETDLNRDVLFAWVGDNSPYRAVSNVALDDKWSALRFRLAEKVKPSVK